MSTNLAVSVALNGANQAAIAAERAQRQREFVAQCQLTMPAYTDPGQLVAHNGDVVTRRQAYAQCVAAVHPPKSEPMTPSDVLALKAAIVVTLLFFVLGIYQGYREADGPAGYIMWPVLALVLGWLAIAAAGGIGGGVWYLFTS
jgi:hypothetical protein